MRTDYLRGKDSHSLESLLTVLTSVAAGWFALSFGRSPQASTSVVHRAPEKKEEKTGGINILLLHPQSAFMDFLVPRLTERGYNVACASTPEAAARVFKGHSIDTTVAMLTGTGETDVFLKVLAESSKLNPVILITGQEGQALHRFAVVRQGVNVVDAYTQKEIMSTNLFRKGVDKLAASINKAVTSRYDDHWNTVAGFLRTLEQWHSQQDDSNNAFLIREPGIISRAEQFRNFRTSGPFRNLTLLIEGATRGVSSTAAPRGVSNAALEKFYRGANLYPHGEFRAYHIKTITPGEHSMLLQYAEENLRERGIVVPVPYAHYIPRRPQEIVTIFKTIIAANQAHVLRELSGKPEYVPVAEFFLERDLEVFRQWHGLEINKVHDQIVQGGLPVYRRRAQETLEILASLAPKEIQSALTGPAKFAYVDLIDEMTATRHPWRSMAETRFWRLMMDSTLQNLGGLWGIFLPTYQQIREHMFSDGKLNPNLLEVVPVFDPQLDRPGLMIEDLVHFLNSYEWTNMPEGAMVHRTEKYLTGLYEERDISSSVVHLALMNAYKAPRKMAIIDRFVGNARDRYNQGTLKTSYYRSLLHGYESAFEHWRKLAVAAPTIAYYVMSEFRDDFSHNFKIFKGAMHEPAPTTYSGSTVSKLIKYSVLFDRVNNPATSELDRLPKPQ
ncbi:hypothetical protein HYU11_02220 [Candidatus Woesearchaeota archaeon]|nr:hypothetical protein [Candidatus Woesearchaeota archaeon]